MNQYKNPQRFQNNAIDYTPQASFDQERSHCQAMIARHHPFRSRSNHQATIIDHLSPFCLRPTKHSKQGILLIHGLYDSPYSMRALAHYFQQHGFTVYTLLLPGHATVPGDLLNIQSQQWRDTVQAYIEWLQQDVAHISIAGFSLGATLAIDYVQQHPNAIEQLFLFAPLIKIKTALAMLAPLQQHCSQLIPSLRWVNQEKETDEYRYRSTTIQSAVQAYRLSQQIQKQNQTVALTLPCFMAISLDDETVDPQAALHFFNRTDNPVNRLIVYSPRPYHARNNSRIQWQSSKHPALHIDSYSHICLLLPPEDPHYGRNGRYLRYRRKVCNTDKAGAISRARSMLYGALNPRTKKKIHKVRLSYHPRFNDLLKQMTRFLNRA